MEYIQVFCVEPTSRSGFDTFYWRNIDSAKHDAHEYLAILLDEWDGETPFSETVKITPVQMLESDFEEMCENS